MKKILQSSDYKTTNSSISTPIYPTVLASLTATPYFSSSNEVSNSQQLLLIGYCSSYLFFPVMLPFTANPHHQPHCISTHLPTHSLTCSITTYHQGDVQQNLSGLHIRTREIKHINEQTCMLLIIT